MEGEANLVTVFRSGDMDAEDQAIAVRDLLQSADIAAEVYDDSAPGIPVGAYEVRVPPEQSEQAEALIRSTPEDTLGPVDLSHDLDMVPIFSSAAPNSEMQAQEIRSLLEAHGIASVLISGSVIPPLGVEVRVPKIRLDEARQVLAAAEEAGPAAAEAAERESEAGPDSEPIA